MINEAEKIIKAYSEIQAMFAVFLGLLLQYFMGDKRGSRIAFIITLSTLFVALFITPVIIEVLGISNDSKIANAIYALSALMSVEMLAICIKVLPTAIKEKAKSFLGVPCDS